MKPHYFYHYAAFVEALVILCSDSISETELIKSQQLLEYFVFMMPTHCMVKAEGPFLIHLTLDKSWRELKLEV